MRSIIFSFSSAVFLFFLIFSSCGNDEEADFKNAPISPDKNLLLTLINTERTSGHLCDTADLPAVSGVVWSQELTDVAEDHSQYMNDENDQSHIGKEGVSLTKRLDTLGYIAVVNLLKGGESEEEAIEIWMETSEQCQNIMNPMVTQFGVGTAGPFWTLILAKPK